MVGSDRTGNHYMLGPAVRRVVVLFGYCLSDSVPVYIMALRPFSVLDILLLSIIIIIQDFSQALNIYNF